MWNCWYRGSLPLLVFTNFWACAGFYFCVSEMLVKRNTRKISSEYPSFKTVFIMHSKALSCELGLIMWWQLSGWRNVGQNSALSLWEDSSELLLQGDEEEEAEVWGLQASVASFHVQAFTLLLRTGGEIWLLPMLPSGQAKCLWCCQVNHILGGCLLCLFESNIHAIPYHRAY